MKAYSLAPTVVLLLAVALVGCAASPQAATVSPDRPSAAPKRLVTGILGEPAGIGLGSNTSYPGGAEVKVMVHVGLATSDPNGVRRPRLAETVPTTENGLWKVFLDGRMETTWKIRPNATWQDGVAFTAHDLIFTAQVLQDPETEASAPIAYQSIETIEAPDPRTVTVKWKKPYLRANAVFDTPDTAMPRHLLEKAYLQDKTALMTLPFWSIDFVGTGPYTVRDWVPGSHIILEANDVYVLGRPKIDEITVRFILDASTLIANVLSGGVDMTMGRGFSFEQGIQVQERWPEGTIITSPWIPIVIYPKILNPTPPVVADVRFRRAVLHAIDREAMTDGLFAGRTSVAYGAFGLNAEDRRDLEGSIVRYSYDPRRATQLIDDIGYRKGPDGLFRDAGGDLLAPQLQSTTSTETQAKASLIVVDYWKQLGIGAEPVMRTQARPGDRQQGEFLAFRLTRQPVSLDNLETSFHSLQIPFAENNFRGSNYAGYQNPAMDALIERFNTTIPRAERMQIARPILHELTDQVVIIGLFYDIQVAMIGNRIKNITTPGNTEAGQSWNAEEWDLGV